MHELYDLIFDKKYGIYPELMPNDTIINLSPRSFRLAEELQERLDEKNVKILDAPLNFQNASKEDPLVSLKISGDSQAFEYCKELMELFCQQVFYLGDKPIDIQKHAQGLDILIHNLYPKFKLNYPEIVEHVEEVLKNERNGYVLNLEEQDRKTKMVNWIVERLMKDFMEDPFYDGAKKKYL